MDSGPLKTQRDAHHPFKSGPRRGEGTQRTPWWGNNMKLSGETPGHNTSLRSLLPEVGHILGNELYSRPRKDRHPI